jgi:outer membrane protein assembly factor BamB
MSRNADTGLNVTPSRALPGARVAVTGPHLPLPVEGLPHVLVGTSDARVVAASSQRVRFIVPADTEGGTLPVRIDECISQPAWLQIGRTLADDVHMVDSPVFDRDGRLYVTHSGSRDARPSVPLYRFDRDGRKEALSIEIGNPTSLALGPDGLIYVSSRFDGHVYRLLPGDRVERYATDLGVATGLAFSPDGDLFVGDRSGTVFRVHPDRQVETFATLPSSVAAFHLAYGPDQCLYVTAPTLATHDALYRITPDRLVDTVTSAFGRPQGLAFDATGMLYVVEALAGAAGLFRVDVGQSAPEPEMVVAAPALVGVAFGPYGETVLSSNDTVWNLDGMLAAPIKNVESA